MYSVRSKSNQSHFIATNFKFHGLQFSIHHQKACEGFTVWAPQYQFFSFGKWSQKIFFLEPKDLNDLDRVEAHLYNFCSIFDCCLHASFCWWANAKCKKERGSIVKENFIMGIFPFMEFINSPVKTCPCPFFCWF